MQGPRDAARADRHQRRDRHKIVRRRGARHEDWQAQAAGLAGSSRSTRIWNKKNSARAHGEGQSPGPSHSRSDSAEPGSR